MQRAFAPVSSPADAEGRISGSLAEGEDGAILIDAVRTARQRLLSGERHLLLHADHRPSVDASKRAETERQRLERLGDNRLKRFVFRIDTSAGPRIIKIIEAVAFGERLRGLAGQSSGRREHRDHLRAERLDLAASESRGFLELRNGLRLVRSSQIQTPVGDRPTLETLFAEELARHGAAAVPPLAEAIAAVHRAGFFHADLKPFHAFPELEPGGPGPRRYRLRWLDLGRVGFTLSERQRRINLYQTFRFVLPPEHQEAFISAYCRAAGWQAADPRSALATIRALLAKKLRSHPDPDI